jgi:hypothetical protein
MISKRATRVDTLRDDVGPSLGATLRGAARLGLEVGAARPVTSSKLEENNMVTTKWCKRGDQGRVLEGMEDALDTGKD